MSEAHRIPAPLVESAAERLVNVPARARRVAARQLIEAAPRCGIDLSLLWGTVDRSGPRPRVTQVCLVVPTPGRTAMVYVSGVDDAPTAADPAEQHVERTLAIAAAFAEIDAGLRQRIVLSQALVADHEPTSMAAFLAAGMTHCAELAYLRRRLDLPLPAWRTEISDPSIRVREVGDVADPSVRRALGQALQRTYIDTLDCPGLCGLRETGDVINSHRATGEHDPALWWLIEYNNSPEGVLLLSPFPDQDVVELVYVGLSPVLRGRGLGRVLMARALEAARERGQEMTCAVDMGNGPALRLYEACGFVRAERRTALIRPTVRKV